MVEMPSWTHMQIRSTQVRALQAHVAELRIDEKRTPQVGVAQ
jgi:hypothetical protein